MEIIVRLLRLSLLAFLLYLTSSLPAAAIDLHSDSVCATEIIHEINNARQNPRLYAALIEGRRSQFCGKTFRAPGQIPLRTHEGIQALDEAVRFLRQVRSEATLALSPGMCQAAADHCRDQAGGATGHAGSDRSGPEDRIGRYGTWSRTWAENISYGQRSAREIVLALIIDDGVRGRGHRRNIFNPSFSVAGAAYGPHARFGSVCNIDFAGGYTDRGLAQAQSEMAGTF